MAIKLLITDDDALIRDGLSIILGMDPDFEVVGLAANGQEACTFLRAHPEVDVALMDIRMPVMDGVQAAKEISSFSRTKVLILTTFDEDQYITDAIRGGAKGYLLKNNPPERIKSAIRMVYEGGSVMQDSVLEKLREGLNAPQKPQETPRPDGFSERELEIMALIAKGLSNKEIAGKLFITEGTVKNYISSILGKTGLEHRTQVAIYWLNGGRSSPESPK